jgi:tetratricopeptide (TPR) repeat protein
VILNSSVLHAQSKSFDAAALELKADTLLGQQDYAGALDLYNKIVAKSNKVKDEIYYKRAFALYNTGNFEQALKDINQYLSNNGELQAKALRAYIYQELGDYKNQLADISELIKSNPNPELIRWRASVAMEAGEYDIAQKDIREMLKLNPDPEIESYLALTYYYKEDIDSALIILDKVIKARSELVQSYVYAGSFLLEKEAYDAALEYINTGLKYESANPSLMFYKGIALAEKKNLTEGCRYMYKAFAAGIDDAAGYLKEYCYSAE